MWQMNQQGAMRVVKMRLYWSQLVRRGDIIEPRIHSRGRLDKAGSYTKPQICITSLVTRFEIDGDIYHGPEVVIMHRFDKILRTSVTFLEADSLGCAGPPSQCFRYTSEQADEDVCPQGAYVLGRGGTQRQT